MKCPSVAGERRGCNLLLWHGLSNGNGYEASISEVLYAFNCRLQHLCNIAITLVRWYDATGGERPSVAAELWGVSKDSISRTRDPVWFFDFSILLARSCPGCPSQWLCSLNSQYQFDNKNSFISPYQRSHDFGWQVNAYETLLHWWTPTRTLSQLRSNRVISAAEICAKKLRIRICAHSLNGLFIIKSYYENIRTPNFKQRVNLSFNIAKGLNLIFNVLLIVLFWGCSQKLQYILIYGLL